MSCCGAYGWCFRRYNENNNRYIVEYADEKEETGRGEGNLQKANYNVYN